MRRLPGVETVVQFYETHPINEQQILHDLARDGIALEGLTEGVLQAYDQDHFGGLEAVDVLAERAGIGNASHVLDVCSGMGGPARYLACHRGCRVTGLDVTRSRHEGAIRLTAMVELDHLVDFRLGQRPGDAVRRRQLRRSDRPGGLRTYPTSRAWSLNAPGS